LVVALVAAVGCSKKPEEVPPETPAAETVHVSSYPLTHAVAGQPWSYQAALSHPGAAAFKLDTAPAGAAVDSSGLITWTPAASASGDQRFVLSAELEGVTVTQEFTLSMMTVTPVASQSVDPANPNGATLSVDAPLSPIRGAGVQLPPGALSGTESINLTIATVENAPVPPGVASAGLKPVEFGPTGTAFSSPVTIYVPVSDEVLAQGETALSTYDFATGKWEEVPVLSVDKTNKVVAAQVKHFSFYMAYRLPPPPVLHAATKGSGACEGVLFVSAGMNPEWMPPTDISGSFINGWTGDRFWRLPQILPALEVGQTLQVLLKLDVQLSTASRPGYLLASATKQRDGSFTLRYSSSSAPAGEAAPIESVPAEEVAARLVKSPLLVALSGATGYTALSSVLYASLLPAGADPERIPGDGRSLVGFVVRGQLAAAPLDADADCDGASDALDKKPNEDPPPQLVVSPQIATLRTVVGGTLELKAEAAGAELTWTASGEALGLTSSGSTATLRPTTVGTFRLGVTAQKGSGVASFAWTISVGG
jgi:hypothetical protein